jgi:hypothetical protein
MPGEVAIELSGVQKASCIPGHIDDPHTLSLTIPVWHTSVIVA